MNRVFLYILLIIPGSILFAQSVKDTTITGKVSYQSVENIYVQFDDTQGIKKDDSLFIKKGRNYFPVIKVDFTSSRSVAGILLGNHEVKTGDVIYAFIKIIREERDSQHVYVPIILPDDSVLTLQANNYVKSKVVEPKVSGRVTVQSYSNFSNQQSRFDYQRWRYAFRLNAQNIGSTGLSYSHYINFAYRSSEWKEISSNLGQAIRIYDLALSYDFSEVTSLWFGRHINRKVSNMGTIDGLQFETKFPVVSIGVVVGSRPNFKDMGFNTKLFEYGLYLSRFDTLGQRGMENILGYFEQTNNFKTDRRFLYFQHSNSAIENTRLFLSTEVDLFKKVMGKSKNELTLTSLFASVSIRPSRYVSLYFSYDARKNVIYYETFKSFTDSIYENETRQGFRTRITIQPVRNLFVGVNYGYRFQKGDPKPTNNYGGYITYSLIPVIESGVTASITRLTGIYVDGTTWGARLYKDFNFGMGFAVDYRNIRYKFSQNIPDVIQHSASFNINTRLLMPVYVNLTYEGDFEKNRSAGRILMNLSYRF